MIKKIFGTFGTQALNAICNFVTLWFGTHYLGAEAWGIGGIVLLDVSILLIGVEFLAGSGLIYFTPRKSYRTLFKISYIWSVLIVAFYALIFYLCSFISSGFGRPINSSNVGATSHRLPLFNVIPSLVTIHGTGFVVCVVHGV